MLRHQGTSLMGEISMSGDSPDGSWKGFLEEGALRKGLALLSGASTAPPPSGVGLASCDLPGSGNGSAHASNIVAKFACRTHSSRFSNNIDTCSTTQRTAQSPKGLRCRLLHTIVAGFAGVSVRRDAVRVKGCGFVQVWHAAAVAVQ